jgi:replicative DNA helicase Mcm
MAQSTGNQELIDRFVRFYRNYYRDEISRLAQRYPNEQRSLYIDYDDLYQFDQDLADDYLSQPDQLGEFAEEALRVYDLPADVSLGQAHVRLQNLPESVDIRSIRVHDNHVGRMISVSGIIRKATDVRPKITEAAFECQRCGTMTYIPQTDGSFQEPHECQGCERQGPFRVNYDQSEFVDSQKLRVQESPEGLRGGETPQSIDIDIEDDITGAVTAGDHVTVTGVLHIEQVTDGSEKSQLFDLYMDGVSVQIEDEQFEEMEITEADKRDIVELSNNPDIYEEMVASVAPSIYGYDQEKLSMILQLFSGVTKELPDGSRIRGDLHMLLIGDPGTGKCLSGDSKVTLDGGREVPIQTLVERNLEDPTAVDDGVYDDAEIDLVSVTSDGTVTTRRATRVWKREAPEQLYRIRTASGRELDLTPSHPLFVQEGGRLDAARADELDVGDFVATPRTLDASGTDTLDVAYRKSKSYNAVRLNLPDRWTPRLARLVGYVIAEGHVISREDNTGDVRVTNKDDEIIADVARAFEELDLTYTVDGPRTGKSASEVRCTASEFVSFLEELEPAILGVSATQRVPEPIVTASRATKREFLRAYVDAEGHVSSKQRELTVASMSRELLEGVRSLLLCFDVRARIEEHTNGSYRLRICGDCFERYVQQVGFVTDRKRAASTSVETDSSNTNVDVVPNIGDELERIRERLRLSQFDCGVPRTTYQHYERGDRNPSRQSLETVVEAFRSRLTWLRAQRERLTDGSWEAVERVRRELDVPQQELAESMGVEQTTVSYYERSDAVPDGGRTASARATLIEHVDDALEAADAVERLEACSSNDVAWDRIESIALVEPDDDWVYDLEVEDTHSYVANGVLSHNSQLLSYIRNIAPRSVYTSGKGSSSAGLTAAAVRDDFGDGQQWSLEAGALVLADQGIAAVDELDKMRCVTGETLVHLADGSIRRIEELARDAAAAGTVEELGNGRTIRNVDLDAWTMTDDGRIVSRPVTAIHEYEAPAELTEVRLETGERLSSTADHPFFVFEDGERTERAAADLGEGDWVCVPRSLSQSATDGGTVRTACSGSTPPLADTDGEGITPAFGAVLGYLSGDGNVFYSREHGSYGIRFTNAEAELLDDFERVCRAAFDAEPVRAPSERRDDGVETVRLSGRDYADAVLGAGMNLRTYDEKAFPEGLSDASRTAKAAFVRALADSEGTVDTRTGNVRIASSSYELLLGTKQLLLEFEVSSQIQTREREDGRDLFVLAVTAADSLRSFAEHVGFTLDRKASALETVRESAAGDRTILDVLPHCGDLLRDLRTSLRLYQAECGINEATYCDFENGTAHVSLRLAREILDAFEERRRAAAADLDELSSDANWETIETVVDRYHVSQSELAAGLESLTQQAVSRNWGADPSLQSAVVARLRSVLCNVSETTLDPLRSLVEGDVKWRRVAAVETVDASADDDRIDRLQDQLADALACERQTAVETARQRLGEEPTAETWGEIRRLAERYGLSLRTLAESLDVHESTLSRWTRGVVETDRFDDVRAVVLDHVEAVRSECSDLLDEIEDRRRARNRPRVYDLTVEGTHNFVANGMVVHNSEDRSAMHEALEQQSISISKAGINATLKSRCSLLGAANPKYGRFDQYEPIGEQIDLEPALISRFDLIFTVTDQPDPEEDAALADHILRTNYAGELNTQRTEVANPDFSEAEVESVTDTVEPAIEPDLLRKYIAYAKRSCYPTMTDEAKAAIRDFYVDLRAKGADEDAPVPVTARKLEALVRLSEASARVRLSDSVEREDAERVIGIVRSCLQDIGVDPETGEFDADMIETGTSKSQRDRIKSIKDVIETVDAEYEGEAGAPLDAIVERAQAEGIEEEKVMDQIEQLRRKGDVYSPSQDQYKVV